MEMGLFIPFSDPPFLVTRNSSGFYVLILYPATLPNLCVSSNGYVCVCVCVSNL